MYINIYIKLYILIYKIVKQHRPWFQEGAEEKHMGGLEGVKGKKKVI